MSKSIADLCDDLDKAIGENSEAQAVTQWIDTGSPELNYAISGQYDGGLPYGRLVEIFGESSTGKTALATKWMVEAQKMGGVAIFEDWERSFDVDLAQAFGLSVERPYWIYKRPKTWEEGNVFTGRAVKAIREAGVIPDSAPILAIHDSIAAAIPSSVMYDAKGNVREMDTYSMNDTTALARVTSTTLKAMAQIAAEYNATFLYLNQIRLKPGVVYGDPRTTPGGKAMEYYSSARIALGRQKIMEQKGGEKEFAGQIITAQVTKSKFTKPFKEADMRMTFDEGGVAHFDMTHSLLEFLIKKGAVSYSKPYVTWDDGKKYHVKALAKHIDETGQQAALMAKLPALPGAVAAV